MASSSFDNTNTPPLWQFLSHHTMPHNTRTRRTPCTIYSPISTITPSKTCTQTNPPMATCRHRQHQSRCTVVHIIIHPNIQHRELHSHNVVQHKIQRYRLTERHVPSKFTTSRFHQPWITTEIKRITRRKQRAYNIIETTPPPPESTGNAENYKNRQNN